MNKKEKDIKREAEYEAMKKWIFAIYEDPDFWDNDINEFNRFVEGLKGIKSTGIIINGVVF